MIGRPLRLRQIDHARLHDFGRPAWTVGRDRDVPAACRVRQHRQHAGLAAACARAARGAKSEPLDDARDQLAVAMPAHQHRGVTIAVRVEQAAAAASARARKYSARDARAGESDGSCPVPLDAPGGAHRAHQGRAQRREPARPTTDSAHARSSAASCHATVAARRDAPGAPSFSRTRASAALARACSASWSSHPRERRGQCLGRESLLQQLGRHVLAGDDVRQPDAIEPDHDARAIA